MYLERLARRFLPLVVIFTFVMAVIPNPPTLPGNPWDKTQHILAFSTLTLLAMVAFPRSRFWPLFGSLFALGVSIEVFQAIPTLHRDSSSADIAADALAVLCTWFAIKLVRRLRSK